MSYKRYFTLAIADAMLSGPWLPEQMQQRAEKVLGESPKWVAALANNVYQNFIAGTAATQREVLTQFIINDPGFHEVWINQRQQLRIRQFSLKPLPSSAPLLQCEIPRFVNPQDLAHWLGLTHNQLDNYAHNWRSATNPDQVCFRHYYYRWKKKQGNRQRLLEIPKSRMREVQRQIYLGILIHIPVHEACHGFRRGHSSLSYAEPHVGKHVVVRMDLENFFVSLSFPRIHALYKAVGYNDSISRKLAGLCTHLTPADIQALNRESAWQIRQQFSKPHLPQGSPSSPALANLCAFRLDLRLCALADRLGADYTRYADDLAFSGDHAFTPYVQQLAALVAHIAATEGFSLNHRKTRVMHQGVSQRLTGITVNKQLNYPRKQYDQLKAILFNCVRDGPQLQNREKVRDFRAHLLGRIAHVQSINPTRAERLLILFRQIQWTESGLCN